jgi:hypothetical protein
VNGLRQLWRLAREVPVFRTIAAFGDRLWWWRAIVRSGLVDAEYYAAQRGRRRTGVRRAAFDYVGRGHRAGRSLNPLVDEIVLGQGLPEPDRVPPLYAYLVSDRLTVRVNPWWDAPADPRPRPDGAAPLDHVWATRDAGSAITLRAGRRELEVTVEEYRRQALEAVRELRAGAPVEPAAPGSGTTVLRYLGAGDPELALELATAVELADSAGVVLAAIAPGPSAWVSLRALRRLRPEIGLAALAARTGAAVALAEIAPQVDAGTLVVIDPRQHLTTAEVLRLAGAAGPRRAVAPVGILPDGTIDGVGAADVAGRTVRLLRGHPADDLDAFDGRVVDVPLLTGGTFAARFEDLAELGTLRPAGGGELEDLSRRWRSAPGGVVLQTLTAVRARAGARVAPMAAVGSRPAPGEDSRADAEAVLALAGFAVEDWRTGASEPVLRRNGARARGLRWAVKIASPAGPAGDVWGDTHFARGLAAALRRLGQDVVVDAIEAADRASSYLDDVTLVVRGPERIDPPGTGLAIEWIISHPDHITTAELAGFDLVFAASERWSATAGPRLGREIVPLLECTDTDVFHPRGLPRGSDIVFVGTSRGIARPSVVVPLAAGIPVRVYGPDWRTHIPASAIAAPSIPNVELPARYETATLVLNDHWPAMRREGFMAMRPFDVVAAGGRVVSEDVDGLAEIFGAAVVAYRSEEELVDLLSRDPDTLFPPDDELAVIAERVRREHSFDARAGTLVAAAEAALASNPQKRPSPAG